MKKIALLLIIISLMLPSAVFSQFETVWYKKLESHVNSVVFSHNSKYVMAHLTPNLKIFDVETGELVNDKIPATEQNPFFSLDDTHVYSIENNRIAYYDLETGLNESTAIPFSNNVTSFSVSNDQKYLLGATKDSSVVGFGVWDLKTGELLKYKKLYSEFNRMSIDSTDFVASCNELFFSCENDMIYTTEFTRNRKLLSVGPKGEPTFDLKYSNKLNVYDFNTLDSIGCIFNEATNYAFHYILSNDCQKMALQYQHNDISIKIYNISTMDLISNVGISNTAKKFKFTSDDKYLVTATSAGADVWETSTGKFIKKVEGGTLYTLDLSNDMKFGATSIGEYLYIFKMSGITDVPQEPENTEVVYPNPTDGNVILRFNLPKSSAVTATIAKLDGSSPEVLFKNYLAEGENTLQFKINQYTAGTYFITLNAADYNKIFKIIIVK